MVKSNPVNLYTKPWIEYLICLHVPLYFSPIRRRRRKTNSHIYISLTYPDITFNLKNMPSKKEKHQQALAAAKAQTTPLTNSTNTTPSTQDNHVPFSKAIHTVTTTTTTTTTKKANLNNDLINNLDSFHRLVFQFA